MENNHQSFIGATAHKSSHEESLDDKLIDVCSSNASIMERIGGAKAAGCCSNCSLKSCICLPSSNYDDHFASGEFFKTNRDIDVPNATNFQPFIGSDDDPLINPIDDDDDLTEFDAATNGSDHCHTEKPSKKRSWQAMTKLLLASILTIFFMIGEGVGGYLANSISIMSDAAHLLSDLTSFIVSLIAIYLAMRPASKKMSYGYQRAEVLGAVISVLIIWLITGVLVYIAIERVITMDFEIEANTMIIVSAIGVFINIILGIVLHTGSIGGHGHSHGGGTHSGNGGNANSESTNDSRSNINIRAAFIHVLGDLIQSIGVFISAYIIKFYPDYKIADPICTFIFSVIVMITTIPILRDLAIILMEGTPPGVDYNAILSHLSHIPGVKMVHSLHVWALTIEKKACSVHLAINHDSDSEIVLRDAQRIIRYKHHIYQTTIQVEKYRPEFMDNCQQCQPLSC